MRVLLALCAAGALLVPSALTAHPLGGPAVAWPATPHSVGVVVDRSFVIEWYDTNYVTPAGTGTISIDWYYTPVMPPTFPLGAWPDDLVGTPIVRGIDEADRADAYTWDTSTVAPGSYWVWSHVNDIPSAVMLSINAFSRGMVTVAHPGDAIHPAIAMTTPESPFRIVESSPFAVVYEAFDPHGTGRVTLEALATRTSTDVVLIATDLPAVASATVSWDVSALPYGDWILRATIRDARGLSATAYGRFMVTIEVQPLRLGDAGIPEDGEALSMSSDIGSFDAGERAEDSSEGCGCSTGRSLSSQAALVWVLGLVLLRRRFADR